MEQHKISTAYLPLENVESEHCALIVDKSLSSIEGMADHKVELNNRRALIAGNDLNSLIPKAVKQIRDIGYNVTTVVKHVPVLNMTCASCANSSQGILEMQNGVISASVNYANNDARIEFVPEITNLLKLKSALQSIGYDLLIEDENAAMDSMEEINRRNYRNLRNKTIGAVAFSIPLVIMAMVPALMENPMNNYWMWLLATPVVLWFGRRFFIGAWKQLKHKSANMDTLVALSTGVAYIFSVFNTVNPQYWHNRGLHSHVYFETAAVVIAFILLGKMLEEKAKGNTSRALKKLMGLQPKTVTVVHPGGHHAEIPVEQVKTGDLLMVKPGEKIAVDGTVTEGSSYVDESMISGEPLAVQKTTGAMVYAGTINQKGSFQFKAEKVGSETLLSQIIKSVQDAQGSKAPVQKTVDKIAGIFVPIVIVIAIISLLVWAIFGGANGLTQGLLALVTVLVIACPCALGLATPTAIMVGVGKGAEKGILIKDAESLEVAKEINAIVLDKTGTITEGKPRVTDIFWIDESSENRNALFTIEKSSEHPLAEAVVNHLRDEADFIQGIAIENITGQGIQGKIGNKIYTIGNHKLTASLGVKIPEKAESWSNQQLTQAQTVIYFSSDKKLLAGIAIADTIKETSAEAIKSLQSKSITVYMLTGDNEATARAVAEKTGILHYKANVLPEEKSEFIKELQARGQIVAMAGDGINDSTALAQSDLGIAMGTGSDIAMDVAKITLISGDLRKIEQAISLSSQTVATIKQNLFWAFIYNIIGIPIAAGILYPFNGFLLNPMIAGAAMALSSISVVLNSLKLKLI